jgi:Flp pilus assembly protein TadB
MTDTTMRPDSPDWERRAQRARSGRTVQTALAELERELERDDPLLASRFRRLERGQRRNDVAVFALLALSVVLLASALATNSVAAWITGAVVFVASFAVDTRHHRALRRLPD